jgi:hypothetical protein
MSEQYVRHPLIERAMNRGLSLQERRDAFRAWSAEHVLHVHPGRPAHSHADAAAFHRHEEPHR